MKLTPKQTRELWGESGPYSQANLKIEERVLDDFVSRTFVYVKVSINPFTYRFVKKNLKHFETDILVQKIIAQGKYKNFEYGFESLVHGSECVTEEDIADAHHILIETRQAIIRMHQFVMNTCV